jgi:hypothetical protein
MPSAHHTPDAAHDGHDHAASADSADRRAAPLYDGWALDEQLRHIERRLQTATPTASPDDSAASSPKGDSLIFVGRKSGQSPRKSGQSPASAKKLRLDAAHGGPSAHHFPRPAKPRSKPRGCDVEPSTSGSFSGALTWLSLSAGTAAFVCGGVLLGWSIVTGRQELWTIGTPVALGGQVALLIGLVLQLDRLWHDSRHAAAKLDTVDEQLQKVRTATSLLGTTVGPSSSFYAHLAGGAGPQLLLSDLKGQLDLLALRMKEEA